MAMHELDDVMAKDYADRARLRKNILKSLTHSPATCEELCFRLGAKHQSVSAAIVWLRRGEYLFWDGKKPTTSGHLANICHITQAGEHHIGVRKGGTQ